MLGVDRRACGNLQEFLKVEIQHANVKSIYISLVEVMVLCREMNVLCFVFKCR